jgi:hypothetical protein
MMKRLLLLVCLIATCSAPLPATDAQVGQGCSACSLVQRALKDAQGLKPGMARKDIQSHNFIDAGGMIFRDRTTYVYKDCDYISLEIEFEFDPKVGQEFSPKDTIKGISKLIIDYPAKD